MSGPSRLHLHTYADYVALEQTSSTKHEFFNGEIYVEAIGLATFPDVSVICGPLVQHEPSPQSTALNPAILVEVTSDSSETYDTGFKLDAYKSIPSLQDYIVVSHRERRITVHHREASGQWTTNVGIRGGSVEIRSLATTLRIDEVYRASVIR